MTFEEANNTLKKYNYGRPMVKGENVVEALEETLESLSSFGLNIHHGVCNNCKHCKECEAPKYPPVYECMYYEGERN